LSFLVYLSVGSSDSQSNFFFSPSRVWELTAGALAYCFFATQQGATRFKIFYAVFPPLGLAIIVTAFLMDQDLNGGTIAWTFLAILGSFLVLAWTQPGGKFAGAISLKPLRTIGKYSYSIYLWHWPVLVYSKLWKIDHLLIPLIVIALLACLSKLVLEDYGRSYLRLRRPSRTVIFYLTSVFVVVTMGLGAVYSNGGIFRYGVSASLWGDLSERRPLEQCPRSLARDLAVSDNCTMLGVAPKPGTGKVLIVGDSHAEALAWGINVQLRSHHASGILVKSYSCAPILGASLNVTPQSFRDCSQALELERHLILAGGFEAIIFAAKWELPFQNLDSGSFVDTNSRRAVSQEKLRGLFRATLLLAKQNANRVVVIQQAPKQGIEPRNLYLSIAHMNLSKHQANALILRRSSSLLNAEKELARSRDTLNKLSRDAGVLVVDPLQIMCTQKCPIGYAARSSYLDSTHVSDWGSLKIAQSIWSEIQDGDG
jgi:hypothetical protein